jgi:hypothetical protein
LTEILNELKSDTYSPVSLDKGFNITATQSKKLPAEFNEWEFIYDNLPFYIASYRVKDIL